MVIISRLWVDFNRWKRKNSFGACESKSSKFIRKGHLSQTSIQKWQLLSKPFVKLQNEEALLLLLRVIYGSEQAVSCIMSKGWGLWKWSVSICLSECLWPLTSTPSMFMLPYWNCEFTSDLVNTAPHIDVLPVLGVWLVERFPTIFFQPSHYYLLELWTKRSNLQTWLAYEHDVLISKHMLISDLGEQYGPSLPEQIIVLPPYWNCEVT